MKKVFIVRPFGLRTIYQSGEGTNAPVAHYYDFDPVEKDLIRPAMDALKLTGGTTGEIFQPGNIREDMFSELLLADIVIADISVYNPNVFYELGIRHALRDKITILIKCKGFDETPFDILAYKYLAYPKDNPADALQDLVRFISESINADRTDSPVFDVLPLLASQDPEKYMAVPTGFKDEYTTAYQTESVGKLALLADEASYFSWKLPAFRLIAEALYQLKTFDPACKLWEEILVDKPDDLEANERLATIYQRLAEPEMALNPVGGETFLSRSDLAIGLLLKHSSLTPLQRAEAFALKARNAKFRWLNQWKGLSGKERGEMAINSIFLQQACDCYEEGFNADLNHFYSGLNALALMLTTLHLAAQDPDTWAFNFDNAKKADQALQEATEKAMRVKAAVEASINAANYRLAATGETDPWLMVSEADLLFLTSDESPRVAHKYSRVFQIAARFNTDAIIRQLTLYRDLGYKTANVEAVLNALPDADAKLTQHNLLFTGHMIDRKDREKQNKKPRFPESKKDLARELIKTEILKVQSKLTPDTQLVGIAGGACGGDIIFHEICRELGISSVMYLALPPDDFVVSSVAFAGREWIARFNTLLAALSHPVLASSKELPDWLAKRENYDIWQRNNQWLINSALTCGPHNMSLITLWDGKGGDGPGGTEHMVKAAEKLGAAWYPIDANQLIS